MAVISQRLLSLTGLALLLGLVITAGLVTTEVHKAISTERELYEVELTQIKNLLARRMTVAEESLHNLRVLFEALSSVESDEFNILAQDVLERHAFVQSVIYLPRVGGGERDFFEQQVREQGNPGFTVIDVVNGHPVRAAVRDNHFPLLYQKHGEPVTAGSLGLDLLAIDGCAAFIGQAIDSGEPTATLPEQVLHESPGFMLFQALYSGIGIPAQLAERQASAKGIVAVRMNVARLLSSDELAEGMELALAMRSPSLPARITPMVRYGASIAHLELPLLHLYLLEDRHEITIGSQSFVLDFRKDVHWKPRYYADLALGLGTGFSVTLLLWLLARAFRARAHDLQRRHEDIQKLVEQRTEELAREKERAQITLEAIADAVVTTDADSNVVYFNPVAERLSGLLEKEVLRQPVSKILKLINEASGEVVENPLCVSLRQGQPVTFRENMALLSQDGEPIAIDGSSAPIRDRSGTITGAVFAFRDVSEARRLARQMAYQATHDALTNLPNRVLLMDRLEQEISRAPWRNEIFGVMFLDLDRFKIINDSLGHDAGDELLRQVAQRLSDTLRPGDTISRLGGDEFVIILSDVDHNDDIIEIVEKLHHVLNQAYRLAEQEIFAQASIGIAVYPEGGKDPGTLMKNADSAMYQAKSTGKNNYVFYSGEINARTPKRLALETDLRYAITRAELQLYYQPQVQSRSERIVGAEALIRWQHPQRGMIVPKDFLPIAEESNLIAEIGEWVMHEACKQNRRWQDMGLEPIKIAVNISDRQFHNPKLEADVRRALDSAGLNAEYLELELTEGILAKHVETSSARLNQLKEMGVKLSIDDFGTGYSSLAYLKRFPLDSVKVDRLFVKDLAHDNSGAEICSAIIAMAHHLNLTVVGEGVETQFQLEFLRRKQCDFIQGYYFSPPVDAEQFAKLLQTGPAVVPRSG